MIDPARFIAHLGELGVELFTGVPDSLLKPLCSCLSASLPPERHVIAANEGAAVGLAIGHYLGSGRPALVYLQNSGIGHAVNPLLSLADPDVYGVPMLLLVGWRGQPGIKDEPQHVKQGRVMERLLDAIELPWGVLPRSDGAETEFAIRLAVETAVSRRCPFVFLVEKGTFEPSSSDAIPVSRRAEIPSREEALIALVETLGDDCSIVSTTGMLSRELFENRQATDKDGLADFLTVGGMGHASSIALGLALRDPNRDVWCLDGDGALLMHMGTLAVTADLAPRNYFHVIFNNGVHDSVGGQRTAIGVMDVPAAARSAGYRFAAATDRPDGIAEIVAEMRGRGGPSLLELRVRPGSRADVGRPTRSPAAAKRAFMAALGTLEE